MLPCIQISQRLCGAVLLVGLLAGLALSPLPAAADLKTGVTAYRAGDYKTALREFTKLAEAGEPNGQFNLAVLYLSGRGVERDVDKAVHWHRKAAAQGLTAAEHGLGVFYYQGVGVERDYAAALKWFRQAAAKGFAESEFNLGVMYFNREGVKRDDIEVVKWISLAAGRKFAPALFRMGQMYEQGVIFVKDLEAALYWYRQAEKRGNSRAAGARARVAKALNIPTTPSVSSSARTAKAKAPARKVKPEESSVKKKTSTPVDTPKPRRKPPIPDVPPVAAASPVPNPPPTEKSTKPPAPQLARNTTANAAPVAVPAPPPPKPKAPALQSDGWKNPFSLTPPPRPSSKAAPRPAVGTREIPGNGATVPANTAALPKASPASGSADTRARPETSPAAREWRVQFAAFRTAGEAKQALATLNDKAGAAIGRTPRLIAVADLGERGIFHRVQAGPVEDANAAARLCALVKAVLPKQPCFPIRTSGR